jgi:hypothetical protein
MLRTPDIEIDAVVIVHTTLCGIPFERHHDRQAVSERSAEAHGRQRSLTQDKVLIVHLQTAVDQEETVAVEAMVMVVHRAVALQRDRMEAHTQHILHARRHLRHLREEIAGGTLPRRIGVAHNARTGTQTPLAAPEIADDGTHRTTVSVVDSISLLGHDEN